MKRMFIQRRSILQRELGSKYDTDLRDGSATGELLKVVSIES